jgi:hypothetical protein
MALMAADLQECPKPSIKLAQTLELIDADIVVEAENSRSDPVEQTYRVTVLRSVRPRHYR